MTGLLSTLAALALIAALITIHEFGHFIAAKAMGVGVKVFSVGIGGRLYSFYWRGTEYRLSWLPFGGYVRMAGADPFMEGGADEEPVDPGASFMSKPPWKRLVILFAGPAMNLVLPFFVFTLLMVAGEPQPRADIGTIETGSPAERAGLLPGDRIVEVEGATVNTWADLDETWSAVTTGEVDLGVERGGTRLTFALPLDGVELGNTTDPNDFGLWSSMPDPTVAVDDPASPAGKAGLRTGDVVTAVAGQPVRDWNTAAIRLADAGDSVEIAWRRVDGETTTESSATLRADASWAPAATPADDAAWRRWGLASGTTSVANFAEDAAAKAAGVAVGDRLLAVDGRVVRSWFDVVDAVADTATGEGKEIATRPLGVTVRRDGRVIELSVTPKVVQDTDAFGRYRWRPLLGLGGGGALVQPELVPRPYPLHTAAARASRETTGVATFIVEQIGKLFTNEAAIRESLGGPVEIFRQTRAAAERGIFDWARQLGLFSLSLGIINLLPIPVLDGGQIVIYLAEWVRGRPLPLILRERAQQAGVIFLVLLMLFVLVNDLHRAAVG